MTDVSPEPDEARDPAPGGGGVVAERPPTPPAFRRGDPRREAAADPERCEFCQRHPRKPARRGGGPRPKHCDHVWGQDHRGKDVTCARLDDALDLWLAAYGGTGPLSRHDVGAPARHLADLLAASEALVAALDPVRGDLDRLDERLTGEVAQALVRAEDAAADADRARGEARAAEADRDAALAAKQAAVADAAEARRSEGAALVERDQAEAARKTAETREKDANTRAGASLDAAKHAQESLSAANKNIAEQAEKIGQLSAANAQLTARAQQLAADVQAVRDQLRQQAADAAAELEQERTAAAAALERVRADTAAELAEQRRAFEQQRENAAGRIADLTGQVSALSAHAEDAKAAAARNQAAADGLQRLRRNLLLVVAEIGPDTDTAQVKDRLARLAADETPTEHDPGQEQDEP